MKMTIAARCVKLAEYLLTKQTTVRGAAKMFGISKSTVHKDLAERLAEVDKALFESVKVLFDFNLSVRHLRGGESTKKKYVTGRE